MNAAEVIVLTRPHVVAEFFHVDCPRRPAATTAYRCSTAWKLTKIRDRAQA